MAAKLSLPEVEEKVIGLILNEPSIPLDPSYMKFKVEYFTGERKVIAESIIDLAATGQLPDIVTVGERLEVKHPVLLENIGGVAKLVEYQTSIPYSETSIDQFTILLKQAYERRALQEAARDLMKLSENPEISVSDAVATAQSQLMGLEILEDDEITFEKYDDLSKGLLDVIIRKNTDIEYGIKTGFRDLDEMTNGLEPGQVITLGAASGSGKTAFALNVATNVAFDQHKPVVFFSLEMSGEELTERIISSRASISQDRVRRGKLSENDWFRFAKAQREIHDGPLYVESSGSTSVSDIRARCSAIISEEGHIGLIVVDYLQLMVGSGGMEFKNESQAVAISQLSRSMKLIAKEFNAPLLMLTQFNRSGANEPNKRPKKSHVAGSQSLENDSDIMLLMYRDESFYPNTGDQGIAEIEIAKQRAGGRGVVRLAFQGEHTTFRNLAKTVSNDNYNHHQNANF